jgi:hypothetical protein
MSFRIDSPLIETMRIVHDAIQYRVYEGVVSNAGISLSGR